MALTSWAVSIDQVEAELGYQGEMLAPNVHPEREPTDTNLAISSR